VKNLISILIFTILSTSLGAQGNSIDKMKIELENSADPVAFAKNKIRKKYKIDTVVVTSNKNFLGIADSLAYYGKLRKVYGPFPNNHILLQVIGKAPNTFYRASHIFIDTSKMRKSVASNLADTIIAKVKRGDATFDDMARIYSMDGSGLIKGDLGWRARGTLAPALENAILKRKKGAIFKVYSPFGLHVVKVTETPRQDTGFALFLRIIL
jgi:parvulin-like peptidyl-prolyl isomerase